MRNPSLLLRDSQIFLSVIEEVPSHYLIDEYIRFFNVGNKTLCLPRVIEDKIKKREVKRSMRDSLLEELELINQNNE
jgi:hypothetical protein